VYKRQALTSSTVMPICDLCTWHARNAGTCVMGLSFA
jgi:hypothetical protein